MNKNDEHNMANIFPTDLLVYSSTKLVSHLSNMNKNDEHNMVNIKNGEHVMADMTFLIWTLATRYV